MREILFRGKRTDNGEWVEGYYYKAKYCRTDDELCDYITVPHPKEYNEPSSHYIVDPDTVGQYTGLKDKNGKRIFEGDIVKTDKFSEPNKQYIIKYDLQFGAFIGQDRYNSYFVTFDGDSVEFEVIGNIHDKKLEDFENGC